MKKEEMKKTEESTLHVVKEAQAAVVVQGRTKAQAVKPAQEDAGRQQPGEPRRLSKWGEWIKNPDREVWIINDMRAVLR